MTMSPIGRICLFLCPAALVILVEGAAADSVAELFDGMSLPLWLKVAHTGFVLLLIPVYWRYYGAANFLWFSDIAMIGCAIAMWLESPLLASMMALAVLLPETAWTVDYLLRLATKSYTLGFTHYMFDGGKPRFLRAISLFHIYLPPLLLWMIHRIGYDSRALVWQTVFAWIVLLITYRWTNPKKNINWTFGLGNKPGARKHSLRYLLALMIVLPIIVYIPTHFLLRWLFG